MTSRKTTTNSNTSEISMFNETSDKPPTRTERVKAICERVLALPAKVCAGVLLGALIPVLLLAGCGSTELVCQGPPTHVIVIPSTSRSDLTVDRAETPIVVREVVTMAASSCGRLTVGLQNNRPEADLALHTISLTSPIKHAFNRRPEQTRLITEGTAFVQTNLVAPLKNTGATTGSPFLGTLVKVGAELQADGGGPAVVILIGDGEDLEPAPLHDGLINLTADQLQGPREVLVMRHLAEFVPLLRPLAGDCVMLVGAGAANELSDSQIRLGQQLIAHTLNAAGVRFVATRSTDLPVCPARP